MEVSIEDVKEEDDVEVAVHQRDNDSDASAKESEFNDCIKIVGVTNLTPSVDRSQLGVVRCTLVLPEKIKD